MMRLARTEGITMARARRTTTVVAGLAALVCATPLAVTTSFAFDVTACGQTIEAGEIGVLPTDLDCPTDPGSTGLFMEPRAVFDLNGHTFNGGAIGVFCDGECAFKGPGVLSGAEIGIISETYRSRMKLENLTLSGHKFQGVYSNSRKGFVKMMDVVLDANLVDGDPGMSVVGGPRIKARNVIATNNGGLVFGGGSMSGDNVILDNNALAIHGPVTLRNSSITNTAGIAIDSPRAIRLKNTTVADSGPGGDGVDLRSFLKPILSGSSCTHSQVCDKSGPGSQCVPQPDNWGVCTDD